MYLSSKQYRFDLSEPRPRAHPGILAQIWLVGKPNVAPYGRTLAFKCIFKCFWRESSKKMKKSRFFGEK